MRCINCKSLCWKVNRNNERKNIPICSHLSIIHKYRQEKAVLTVTEIRQDNISKCPKLTKHQEGDIT